MFLPYPRYCNPGVLLIFWIFRPRTMVNFGKFSSENTVIFDDFSPKMTKVRPKYVSWGSIQDGVAITRIRYIACNYLLRMQFTISWRPRRLKLPKMSAISRTDSIKPWKRKIKPLKVRLSQFKFKKPTKFKFFGLEDEK